MYQVEYGVSLLIMKCSNILTRWSITSLHQPRAEGGKAPQLLPPKKKMARSLKLGLETEVLRRFSGTAASHQST